MSSNRMALDEHDANDEKTVFFHPLLCEIQDRNGQYGAFHNFRLTRPFLDPATGERKQSNWHTLNQTTLDQIRRLVADDGPLQRLLDNKNHAKPAKPRASKKPTAKKRTGKTTIELRV